MLLSMLDIIIPILNEEKILLENDAYYQDLKDRARVIFVDGGSTDRSVEIAKGYAEVFSSRRGRAVQKNRGTKEAKSEHLLFLHVDSFVEGEALNNIDHILGKGAVGGCLTMRIEGAGLMFRIYEKIVNIRARVFGVIDGDLGMFVRRDIFEQLGGFDALPVMEDIVFSKKLRKAGPIRVLPDFIDVSSRKWEEKGFVRTFWEYTCAYVKLWTGRLGGRGKRK